MKVVVFGAAGFVGRNLVQDLMENDFEILASDVEVFDPPEGVEFVKSDILDFEEVSELVAGADEIIHLAAGSLRNSIENPRLDMEVNVKGTLNILEAAKKQNVNRVIFSSSAAVYGKPEYTPIDESHQCLPQNPYAVAKRSCEHYFRVYQDLYELDYLIFRFFNIYGPHQKPDSGAIIPLIYEKLTEEGSFTLYGDGSQTRDFVFVDDLVSIYKKVLKSGVKNEILNLGSGEETSLKKLLKISSDILNVFPEIEHEPSPPGEIEKLYADTEKLRETVGKVPSTSLKKGLKKTFNYLESYD